MPITILPPLQASRTSAAARPAASAGVDSDVSGSESSDDDGGRGAAAGRPAGAGTGAVTERQRKRRRGVHYEVVTPGELITDDAHWMRGHGTYASTEADGGIVSSLAGTVLRTNRLLSVKPLRARYVPEVGDLVVGRIVEVQARRWRVDVGAAQLAALPLSAINLPGGVLRKRTETDELQIRSFFAEGDLLVAEVQQIFSDGVAVLHTRSLKYGKLRNGVFLAVAGGGSGAGAGVVRARRQVWTIGDEDDNGEASSGEEEAERGGAVSKHHGHGHSAMLATGAEKIDVILGVNGYVFIGAHVTPPAEAADVGAAAAASAAGTFAAGGTTVATAAATPTVGLNNMEEAVSAAIYSSQNDPVRRETMREIARLRSVVALLVEHNLQIDEKTVMRAYRAALDLARSTAEHGEEDVYLGGDRGDRLAATLA